MLLVRCLWDVAPLWRMAVITAISATILLILFPPGGVPSPGPAAPTLLGSYTPAPTAPGVGLTPIPVARSVAPRSPGLKFGDIVQDAMTFNGRMIPLPAGAWRVVASMPGTGALDVATDFKALANEEAGRLRGLLFMTGNDKATPNPAGYRADGNCERSDMIFTNVIRDDDFGEQDCQYIDFMVPAASGRPGGDPVIRAALGDLRERGIVTPSTLVGVSFRFAGKTDLLLVKFWFNPELTGIAPPVRTAWLENDWNKYNLPHDAARQRYVESLKSWTSHWETIMRAAWRDEPLPVVDAADRWPR